LINHLSFTDSKGTNGREEQEEEEEDKEN